MNYITDSFGNTPLKYALQRNSYQCVEELLTNAIKQDEFYTEMQSQDLIDLIYSGPSNLPLFFEQSVSSVDGDGTPKSGVLIKDIQGGCYRMNETTSLNAEQIRELVHDEAHEDVNEQDKKPIELKMCKIKYNFTIGSAESMNFHEALSKSK